VTFSNPAGTAAASAGAYVRALLDLLGERDPLDVLAELNGWLDRRFSGVPEAALRRPEAPGKWSAADVVQHLADSELVLGFRMRMILTEDRPALQGYDQDQFANKLRYNERDMAPALEAFRCARESTMQVLGLMTEEDWQRAGTHSESGRYTTEDWLQIYAAHAHNHAAQIRRLREALS